MKKEILSVLNKIENNGFVAYIVGGYVRDYLLKLPLTDVDIITNATPKDLSEIFDNIKKTYIEYGSVKLYINNQIIDITSMRKDLLYKNNKPVEIEYTNDVESDLKRRDFRINSICMNSEGKIFDYLNGKEDIHNKLIKTIGSTNVRLYDDPVRILRAIRFAIILDFNLDEEILNFIKNNKDLLKSISYTRKKQELEKILTSKNAVKGLNYLKELELLDELEIKYDKIVNVSDILGMWAQMEFSLKYQFTKQSLTIINQIKEIVSYGKIDSYVLLKYGLYVSLVAGEILGYSREDINKMDKQMPIHKISDVKINNIDIMNLLGIDGSPKLRVIYDDIVDEILRGKVKNNKRDIKKYIIKKWM